VKQHIKVRIFLIFIFFLSWSLVEAAHLSVWQRFTSEVGRFQIEAPGEPEIEHEFHDSPVGKIETHIFTWKNGELDFSADYSDLPWLATFFGGRKKILRRARESLMEDEKATELSVEEIRLDDYDGIEVRFTTPPENDQPPLIAKARLFLIKKRLYVLVARAPVTRPQYENIERYLGSFQLLSKR
jgi:hypothetical protein